MLSINKASVILFFLTLAGLLAAQPSPDLSLEAPAFDLATALDKGAQVYDGTRLSGVIFANDPQAGSLKQQTERARLAMTTAAAHEEKP